MSDAQQTELDAALTSLRGFLRDNDRFISTSFVYAGVREAIHAIELLKSKPRSILVQDDDCHWYVIPADIKQNWSDWLAHALMESDDLQGVPEYAARVGGHPSLVTFTGWRIE